MLITLTEHRIVSVLLLVIYAVVPGILAFAGLSDFVEKLRAVGAAAEG